MWGFDDPEYFREELKRKSTQQQETERELERLREENRKLREENKRLRQGAHKAYPLCPRCGAEEDPYKGCLCGK